MYGYREKPTDAPDHPYWTEAGCQRLKQHYGQIQDLFNFFSNLSRKVSLQPQNVVFFFENLQHEHPDNPVTLLDVWHFALWMADIELHDPGFGLSISAENTKKIHALTEILEQAAATTSTDGKTSNA